MGEIIAAAIGVPLTFVLGWWGRGKWERYPWNAKPQRWSRYASWEDFARHEVKLDGPTAAEELRAGPTGQFERQVAERMALYAEGWRSAFDLALRAAEPESEASDK